MNIELAIHSFLLVRHFDASFSLDVIELSTEAGDSRGGSP